MTQNMEYNKPLGFVFGGPGDGRVSLTIAVLRGRYRVVLDCIAVGPAFLTRGEASKYLRRLAGRTLSELGFPFVDDGNAFAGDMQTIAAI